MNLTVASPVFSEFLFRHLIFYFISQIYSLKDVTNVSDTSINAER